MTKERKKQLERLFRNYKRNKQVLKEKYGVPVPSGIAYDKIAVLADKSKNAQEESIVKYIVEREELYKRVFIVDEVLTYFRLEGHGREHFVEYLMIDGNSWVSTMMECHIVESTVSWWRKEILEKANMVADWVDL